MFNYKRLKVRKDAGNIYIHHLNDDFEFQELDTHGLLFNQMITTLLKENGTLQVEVWLDEKRFKSYEKYSASKKYEEYLMANQNTRFDVEPFKQCSEMPSHPKKFWWGIKTKQPLIDESIHLVADCLFHANKGLLSIRENLVFVTIVEEKPELEWFHYIICTGDQLELLDNNKSEFLSLINEKLQVRFDCVDVS